ncbi:MAG: tubulin-like doman-containing protein [Gemmatales bacterium]
MALVKEPNAEPIPGYRLLEPLGSGGFGEVWKCDVPGGIFKAIKFVFGNLQGSENEAIRAEQELNALERVKNIRHPFLVNVERVEQIDGELVIVMELADKDLRDHLNEYRAQGQVGIPRQELLSYLRDAAEALDLIHNQYNLQHLDIKPSNLFLVSNRVKVADFGLVKALEGRSNTTNSGLLGGITPAYASPETFQGELSKNSDQYSLAIVFQELLTGSLPFTGKSARQLMQQHCMQEPDLKALPPSDRAVIARALSKDPAQRFPSCLDFIGALVRATPGARTWATMEDLFIENNEEDPSSPNRVQRVSKPTPGARPSRPGPLRPTYLIGLGEFGREALQAVRYRIIDRFGGLDRIPCWKYIYIDSDPKSINDALTGPPEQAFQPQEMFHAPLNGVAVYRKHRQSLEIVSEWLPSERLYSIPRNLAVGGVRSLGRLALAENHLRIASKMKRDIQGLLDIDGLEQSATMTGLEPGFETPQVLVFAAAGGGTGSGMLIDIAYTCRRLLQEQGITEQEMFAYLFCGAPTDTTTPPIEKGNIYATLTELNHYCNPDANFSARYRPGMQPLEDNGAPFQSVYLARVGRRSHGTMREVASRVASYVFNDLATPLGRMLMPSRLQQYSKVGTPFRSFGTYNVWYPRGLMLRIASRQAAQRLIKQWLREEPTQRLQEVEAETQGMLQEPNWQPDAIATRVEQVAMEATGDGTPMQMVEAFLTQMAQQCESAFARNEPSNWCRDALQRMREWAGGAGTAAPGNEWQRSKLDRLYLDSAEKVANEYAANLNRPARRLFNSPGDRMSMAEAAYESLALKLQAIVENYQAEVVKQQNVSANSHQKVSVALEETLAGVRSFSFFPAKRMQKLLERFTEAVTKFCRDRLAEYTIRAVELVYRTLLGRISELQRDLKFCSQRLKHLEHSLMTAGSEQDLTSASLETLGAKPSGFSSSQMSSSQVLRDAAMVLASRIVLPDGQSDLEQAATKFLASVPHAAWAELDAYLHENVMKPMGGLFTLCMNNSDLPRALNGPLLQGTATYLNKHLEVTDVCQAELSTALALKVDLGAQTKVFHHLATPSIASKSNQEPESDFLLVPNTDAGKEFTNLAVKELNKLKVIQISVVTDIFICREQANLTLADIQQVVQHCRDEYEQNKSSLVNSPHARMDTQDWLPLE